ncbi:MAG: hypothetical protein HKN87_19735 [Saprospiraceae bacterium]|nr:hypothetical protein [Saprospiraceae bacterium]
MIKQVVKAATIFSLALMSLLMISCDKESDSLSSDSVENYIDDVIFNIQKRGNAGKFGCAEFVFPMSITFDDGTTMEVADYPAFRNALRTYREANPDATHPTLNYPIDVFTQIGTIITVDSAGEMRALRMQCRKRFFERHGHKGHRFRGKGYCFKLVFPVAIVFPGGSVLEAAGRPALKTALRAWKIQNPHNEERPQLQFPLTVEMEDETQVTVQSQEELQALKEECSAEE